MGLSESILASALVYFVVGFAERCDWIRLQPHYEWLEFHYVSITANPALSIYLASSEYFL